MSGLRACTLIAVTASLAACATTTDIARPDRSAMSGQWSVDLRPTLESPAYAQPMTLKIADDGTVTGSFYGSPILSGQAGSGQGRTCAFFRTSDNSGPYQHSGCLKGGMIVGQTWSEGRDFIMPWTATRDNNGD